MSYAPRVKICGITSVADAHIASDAGADAIGLVFYEPSPRYVDIESAKRIAREVGPFVTVVGLFVNAETEQIKHISQIVGLNLLQFHGDEPAEYCEQFDLPYMKALRMREGLDVTDVAKAYRGTSAILLDAYRKGVPGGTGESFDWARVPQDLDKPVVLAGGLTPANALAAAEQVKPYALDVSGGVEAAPGKKDPQKVKEFIQNAKAVDQHSVNSPNEEHNGE